MPYRRNQLKDFLDSRKDHPKWPVVVSEGDSWFSHSDVIGQLDDPLDTGQAKDQRAWCLLRREKNGDEILTVLSGSQRASLRELFETGPIGALLFSGGGNDIIGPDLLPLLRPWKSGMEARDAVAFSRFERRLRQIADCYRELLDMLVDAEQETLVFVNSYDYVIPADRPVKLLWGLVSVAGPWMKPYFDQRKIPVGKRSEIVQLLIDGFCATVDQVAAEPRGLGRLVRVETRGVVVDQWKDEIHPNRKGAIRVAKAFETALKGAGVLP